MILLYGLKSLNLIPSKRWFCCGIIIIPLKMFHYNFPERWYDIIWNGSFLMGSTNVVTHPRKWAVPNHYVFNRRHQFLYIICLFQMSYPESFDRYIYGIVPSTPLPLDPNWVLRLGFRTGSTTREITKKRWKCSSIGKPDVCMTDPFFLKGWVRYPRFRSKHFIFKGFRLPRYIYIYIWMLC